MRTSGHFGNFYRWPHNSPNGHFIVSGAWLARRKALQPFHSAAHFPTSATRALQQLQLLQSPISNRRILQPAARGAEEPGSSAAEEERLPKRQRLPPFPWTTTLERILKHLGEQWQTLRVGGGGGAAAALQAFREQVAAANQQQRSLDDLTVEAFKRKYQHLAKKAREGGSSVGRDVCREN